MDRPPKDQQSIISFAYAWATTIIVISAEMVVPGVLGVWIGHWLGTVAMIVLAILGFAGGTTVAILHLLRLTKPDHKTKP
jgi:membrane protein implicated in regulation of membrane protease activity